MSEQRLGRPVQRPDHPEGRIRSLAAMARSLSLSQPLEALIETAAEESLRTMLAASVSLSRLVPGSMVVRTIINVGDLAPHEVRWPEDETYAVEEFAALSLVTEGLQTWTMELGQPGMPDSEAELLRSLGKGASLGAPLIVDGRLWGEFYATRHVGEPGFGDLDHAYLEALLAVLSGALSRAAREESLQQLAYRDPLTGLLNRRALDSYAEQSFTLETGETRRVTVLTMDVNGLKQVNDTLGHVVGDQLLLAIARDMRAAFNVLPSALVARVGGDEFTVMVNDIELEAVLAVSDELCRRTWPFGNGVTLSAGAASTTLHGSGPVDPSALFAAADRAQYVAKRGRLSATVLADETELDPRPNRGSG